MRKENNIRADAEFNQERESKEGRERVRGEVMGR